MTEIALEEEELVLLLATVRSAIDSMEERLFTVQHKPRQLAHYHNAKRVYDKLSQAYIAMPTEP